MKALLIYLFIFSYLILGSINAQSSHRLLRQGDKAFKQENYELAEEAYRKSLDKKITSKGNFNLGNTVYEQQRFEEAAQHFENSIGSISDPNKKAEAYYNLGNAQIQQGELEASIESYKHAVKLNPNDNDFRQNLYKAKLLKREQQQQEQQQQQQQQEEENQNQEQQEQEQQEEQNQQQEEQQKQSEQESQGEENPTPEEQQKMDKREADRYLSVVENKEKELQEKLKKKNAKGVKPKKDW